MSAGAASGAITGPGRPTPSWRRWEKPYHVEVVRAIETWSDHDSWIGKAVADIKGQQPLARGAEQDVTERLRDSLIAKGLCYSPREGRIDFTVPLFDEFLHRQAGKARGMESAPPAPLPGS